MLKRFLRKAVESAIAPLSKNLLKVESAQRKVLERVDGQSTRLKQLESGNREALQAIERLKAESDSLRLLQGKALAVRSRGLPSGTTLAETEFRVFSQWGEDGIIQFLLGQVEIENEIFVEFGVEDYTEANTRFLLQNDHWSGLVMDASREAMEQLAASDLAWRHHLQAVAAWITRDNIDDLITGAGIRGDIGLLSIDIDGMDYWIWERLEAVKPRIVVCEYNALFGPKAKVTVPYREEFDRSAHHFSWLCFGASLPALDALAREKGYRFVGTNRAGNNAFFVRGDVLGSLVPATVEEGFQACRFRESRDPEGRLSYLDFRSAARILEDAEVFDLEEGKPCLLGEIATWRESFFEPADPT